MKIRSAGKSDYQELMSLYNDFVGNERYSNHDNDSFYKILDSKSNYILVAEEYDKLVGFAAFSIRDVIRYPKPIAELDELFVSAEFRKHGIGKALLNRIEIIAKENNCYRMYIESHYDHKPAHVFYEKLGYTNYGFHFIKNL